MKEGRERGRDGWMDGRTEREREGWALGEGEEGR